MTDKERDRDKNDLPDIQREQTGVEYTPSAMDKLKRRLRPVHVVLTSFEAKMFYSILVLLGATGGVLYISYELAGLVPTLIYVLLFAISLTGIPLSILLMGYTIPGNGLIGKLHIVLGQFAFGRGILLQLDDRWEWCPATKNKVYFDGEWHEIVGGMENWSMLGWRPFSIARYKDDNTFASIRVDNQQEAASTDGGEGLTRGGYDEFEVERVDGWVVDLKRVFTPGLKKFGDVELIEKAEEIVERGEMDSKTLTGWKRAIPPIVGLIIGVGTGYLMMS